MLDLLKRHRKLIVVAGLLSFSYMVFFVHVERTHPLTWYDRVFLWTIAPLQDGATAVVNGLSSLWNHYVFLVGLVDENESLRRRVIDLEFKHEELIEAAIENERLRRLLLFQERVALPQVAAEVVALDLSTQFQMIRVNRGRKDGLEIGMPVLAAGGIVGQIFRATGGYADVLLATDRNSSIDAVIQRSRARGIIIGAGRKAFDMHFKYLSRVEDVRVGDLVIASGLDGVFPEGISLGYITEVDRPEVGILQAAKVQPTVEFAKIKEVLVVLRQSRPALPELTEKGEDG